jgi:polysaccharide export outer membrane protein
MDTIGMTLRRLRLLLTGAAMLSMALTPNLVTAQPVAPANPAVEASYRINSGDELAIYVWGEERLQRDIRVLPDGTFAFPLIGRIVAQGKLPLEIEAMITERLREQYRGQVPQVTVSVKQPAGLQFSVMGRVKAPGTFSPGRYVNVLEALSMAGGPTEFANLDSVLILRKRGDQLETIRAKIAPLFKSGANAGDLERSNVSRVQTGDTIIVP